MSDPHWKLVERVVALLEKLLSPESAVTHNQQLPELATGNMRQCDVVIRSGNLPRETLTIVEVQDRSKAVELADYEGWCQKREKLGAQHLICVSVAGFPESVKKDAALRGGAVRLLTLTEDAPPPFIKMRALDLRMEVLHLREVETVWDAAISDYPSVRVDEPIFRVDGVNTLKSVMDIVDRERGLGRALNFRSEPIPDSLLEKHFYTLNLEASDRRVWLDTPSGSHQLPEVRVTDSMEYVRQVTPLQFLAYEQVGFGPTLAWTLLAKGIYEGAEYTLQLGVQRRSDGSTTLRGEMSPIAGLEIVATRSRLLLGPPLDLAPTPRVTLTD